MKKILFILLFFQVNVLLFSQSADDIVGYWYATFPEAKTTPSVIEVIKHNGMYYAYGFSFKDLNLAADTTKDIANPNKKFRERSSSGTVFLYDSQFDEKSKTWRNGTIYRFKDGKFFHLPKGKLSSDGNKLSWRASIDKFGIFGANLKPWERIPQTELKDYLPRKAAISMKDVINSISQR